MGGVGRQHERGIKIVTIGHYQHNQENDEAKLTKLVNDGWVIVEAGGGEERGFVILQKEREA